MNARYYHPQLGRFVSPDSIVPEPGNPQSYNRYSYVFNRPTYFNDPSGNCPWCIGAVGGAIVGGLIGYGTQVYQNMQDGLAFSAALTTNIDSGKIVAGAAVGAVVGGTLGAAAPTLVTYGTVAAAQVQTTAAAVAASHPVATAAVGGMVETAAECALTGGGCGPADYAVGALTAGAAQRVSLQVHGNSRANTVTQHGYEIFDTDSGNIVKVGISGQPLNKNGTSPRANRQINALNEGIDPLPYGARVVEQSLPGRAAALKWERSYSRQQYKNGNDMRLHLRPRENWD